MQVGPVNPYGHWHVNESILWRHVPPFWQGEEEHSSMSCSQWSPEKERSQWSSENLHLTQFYLWKCFKIWERSLTHGRESDHMNLSLAERKPLKPGCERIYLPVNPEGHWQRYPLMPSIQVPPLTHDLCEHSSIFSEHVRPVNPGWNTKSTHTDLSDGIIRPSKWQDTELSAPDQSDTEYIKTNKFSFA